jgi:hypothetical protein
MITAMIISQFDVLQKITSEHSIIASSDVAENRVLLVF